MVKTMTEERSIISGCEYADNKLHKYINEYETDEFIKLFPDKLYRHKISQFAYGNRDTVGHFVKTKIIQ
jgi:hypothetical protein